MLQTKTLSPSGFTLAELLIALAILGVIATFTIPKVLNASTSSQNTAIAKEAASIISGAYSAFQLDNSVGSTTSASQLTQFINYVKVDSTGSVFSAPSSGATLATCSTANIVCLSLHNGGIMQYNSTNTFGGTTTTHSIRFNVDPDGRGAGAGGITFVLFSNGRLSTGAQAGTSATGGASVAVQTTDPTYLVSWN